MDAIDNAPETPEQIAAAAVEAAAELNDAGPVGAGPEATAAPPVFDSARVIDEMVLAPAFAILCPAWKIKPAERAELAAAYGRCFDKWFPDGWNLSKYPELGAIATTYLVIAPHFGTPRKAGAGGTGDEKTGRAERAWYQGDAPA